MLAVEAARSLPSERVTQVLDRVIASRGAPATIQCDDGTEFTSRHFDAWAYVRGIEVDCIRPGEPVENACIESFNGRLRDECLNVQWFGSIEEANAGLEALRRDHDEVRPHSQLGSIPPAALAASLTALGRPGKPAEAAASA